MKNRKIEKNRKNRKSEKKRSPGRGGAGPIWLTHMLRDQRTWDIWLCVHRKEECSILYNIREILSFISKKLSFLSCYLKCIYSQIPLVWKRTSITSHTCQKRYEEFKKMLPEVSISTEELIWSLISKKWSHSEWNWNFAYLTKKRRVINYKKVPQVSISIEDLIWSLLS